MLIFILGPKFNSAQEISSTLDSINKLEIPEDSKIKLYYQLVNTLKTEENHTQLGSDAHQVAKWLHKKADKKKEAIEFLYIAIDSRIKAVPFNPELLRRSYNNLGLYNLRSKKYQRAIEAFKKLVSVEGSNFLNGRAYLRMGDCYKNIDDPYRAIENHKKAFYFFKENKKYLIGTHINIALAYRKLRDKPGAIKAIQHLKIADSLIKSSKKTQKRRLYAIYNNLGSLYFNSFHDTLTAEVYFQKAIDQAKEIKRKDYLANTFYNLGYTNIGKDKDLALEYFDKALKNATTDGAILKSISIGKGILENAKNNYNKASQYYYQALSYFFNKTISPENITRILNQETLFSTNEKMLLLEILKEIIDNYIDQGSKEKKYYNEAIQIVKLSDSLINIILKENITYNSKLLLRSIASGTYASGISACNEVNEIDYGFYLSEKNKALLLIQEISKEKTDIPNSISKKESELKTMIINLQENYNKANHHNKDSTFELLFNQKQKLQSFEDSIINVYPDYKKTFQTSVITPLSEITYDDDQIIIQYMMTERIGGLFPNTYCLILSKDTQKLIKLENTKLLHDKIYAIRKQLNAPFRSQEDIISYREKSYNLYTALIPEEIRPLLKSKKVTIVPDHLIATIPFEALVTDPKSGKYLVEDSEISYTYSLSFQKQNTNRKRYAEKDFLGIAPRDFSNHLSSLKNSTREVKKAEFYYPGLLLLDKDATKDNFIKEQSDYKIIHLATHAFATDSITPWIAFKDKKIINPEIDLLKNNAEMVVLSACNTSLGEVHSGEGILSLARGFFKSGANTVIPSLWSTNDKATATITSDFYKKLSEGQTKSAALRTAKLNYLHNNTDAEASPHYWASLILIGDSGTLLPQSNNLLFLWIGLVILILLIGFFLFKKLR